MIFAPDAMAGRVVLVTGASSGLGRAAAEMIAACGGRIVGVGRDEARLNQTLGALAGSGHQARVCDVSDADAAATLVLEASKEAGGLHGIFHSAGEALILPTST